MQCTLCTQYAVYTMHEVCSVHCTVQYAVYIMHAVCSIHCTVQCTLCMQYAVYTVQCSRAQDKKFGNNITEDLQHFLPWSKSKGFEMTIRHPIFLFFLVEEIKR